MKKAPKEIPWSKLDHESKKTRLGALWAEGLSDNKIGKRLSATKGQIVGFRHTHTDLTAANRGKPPESALVIPTPPVPPPQPVQEYQRMSTSRQIVQPKHAVPEPTKYKVAASEKKQCDHRVENERRCAFEFTVHKRDGNFCPQHEHLHS